MAMREFEFLFLVLLRNSCEDCSIDDLIVNQVVQSSSHSSTMTKGSLQEFLDRERCLVILDGLDEWTHPERECKKEPKTIPHRNAREMCTVLTTTRPWKLSVINLQTSQINKKVELVKLTSEAAQTLMKRAISKIKDIDLADAEDFAKSLHTNIQENEIENLESVPLLLTYLICLWFDDIPLGQSKSGLYESIIELLLSRTVKKYPKLKTTGNLSQDDILQCSREHVYYRQYYTFLKKLGQLAFETLFKEERETRLVFSPSVAESHLTQDLDFGLLSGILTQSKVQEKVTKQVLKVSFSHKTVQEYFCALYISCQNDNDVQKIVQQNFKNLQNILDMSTVFVFISGMNAKTMSLISRELMSVISEDEITRTYRSMAYYDYEYVDPLKDIQNMYISCSNENPGNNDLELYFQDFFIDEDYQEEKYFMHLNRLALHNKITMESISIEKKGSRSLCNFKPINVKKLYYRGEYREAEIIPLLTKKSVKCVTVSSSKWQDNNFIHEYSFCSSKLPETFQNMFLLRAIYIHRLKMVHEDLKKFLNYIIKRKSMVEIRLSCLLCDTHNKQDDLLLSCGQIDLDFSEHLDLRTLALDNVPVSQLKVNVLSLEECHVGKLSEPDLVTTYLRELRAARNLRKFSGGDLESSREIETMLQTIPWLVQVKHLRLSYINLGNRLLLMPPKMVNIEIVYLYKVTLSGLSLRNLVKVVEKLRQPVTVRMRECTITPETEFEDVKNDIKISENFVITFDGINKFNENVFIFQTTEYESRVKHEPGLIV